MLVIYLVSSESPINTKDILVVVGFEIEVDPLVPEVFKTFYVVVEAFVLEVIVFLVVVVDVVFLELETMLPDGEHGKSRLEREAMLVQKYSEDPLEPTSEVPVAVISAQMSLQTRETTSLLLVPVPVTLM